MTETTLRTIDYALMATGGLVLGIAIFRWWLKGPRDPLRGAPLRVNRLGPIHIWLCIMVMLIGGDLGGRLGIWLAPSGLTQQQLGTWQGIFAAGFAAVLNTITCLVVAQLSFAQGLRGFGAGRRGFFYELAVAGAGCLIALFLTGATAFVTEWIALRLFPQFKPPQHGVFEALKDPSTRPWMSAFAILGAFTIVPIGEEMLFRGILQTGLRKLIPPRPGSLRHRWTAVLGIGALFGAVHMTTPQYIPALIVLGMLLGFLYERTGSITVPILLHMLFNGKSLLFDYLARHYLQSQ